MNETTPHNVGVVSPGSGARAESCVPSALAERDFVNQVYQVFVYLPCKTTKRYNPNGRDRAKCTQSLAVLESITDIRHGEFTVGANE